MRFGMPQRHGRKSDGAVHVCAKGVKSEVVRCLSGQGAQSWQHFEQLA
jgi:hypothetical protein